MTVTPGQLGVLSKALSPLRDLVNALCRAGSGALPDSNERRRLVRRVRAAGAAALPTLIRALQGNEGESALAYYLLRRLGGERTRDALHGLLLDEAVGDDGKARALGLLSDLGFEVPEGVRFARPDDLLASSVRELVAGLRRSGDVVLTRDRILEQVALADLPGFCRELQRHGGRRAVPLLRALAGSPLPSEIVGAIAALVDDECDAPVESSALLEGIDYLESGRPRAASKRIARYLVENPRDAEAHSALGACLLELGERRRAIASFERALMLEPEGPLHVWNLAVAARRCKRSCLAYVTSLRYLELLDRAEGATQRRTEARRYAKSMRARQPLATRDDAEEALRISHRLFALGTKQLECNRVDEARDLFEDVLALLPAHYPSWGNLGACFLLAGRNFEARLCLERALEIEPAYQIARDNLTLLIEDVADAAVTPDLRG